MTVSYPYALPYFADRLPISSVEWSVKRNDSLSGQGSGRIWQAELASPLWLATVELDRRSSSEMKQYAALIRKLHGAQEAFFLYDPLSKYPHDDPNGAVLGNAIVRVDSIPSHRASIALKGLPAGYRLLPGDKMQLAYNTNPVRYVFLEISESATTFGDGSTGLIGVFPHIPVGIGVDDIVTLTKPACRMVIMPNTHRPGQARRHLTEGAGFTAIQKP
ncbi:hypothetical protein [Pararhizobium sp. A13]|uniref:hypothetical protein n=1 Tax=Pararhizobium sp. A13 TaxID=3133975 RepID=UPI00324818C7